MCAWALVECASSQEPGAYVIKALNTLNPEVLMAPEPSGWRLVTFFSGDDERAKNEVRRLIRQLGLAGVDLGCLETGGRLHQTPDGALANRLLAEFDRTQWRPTNY
jgi:predicted dinucleotide-binding enzyme